MEKGEKFVLWFDEISKEDVALVGGKNANLGEMYQNLTQAPSKVFEGEKIKVPYGFAVTAHSYRQFISENKLDSFIEETLKGLDVNNINELERVGHKIRSAILNASLPKNVEEEIISAYKKLAQHFKIDPLELDVAVRSSATAEDLPDASFAGQQESYLNISGSLEVLEAIKKAFSSLFTNRAISYRQDKNYGQLNLALSVVVQKMARSNKGSSGVAFTLDTESGFKDVVLINGSWGLGEYVVKGIVNPDEFVVFKPTLKKGFKSIISKKLGSKEKKLTYSSEGTEPTKEESVSTEDRNKFILSNETVLKLARWATIIEDHYGRPMDIEWAYENDADELYITQARPETVQHQANKAVLQEYQIKQTGEVLVKGAAVGAKIGQGKVHVIKDVGNLRDFKKGEVLVTEITDPDWEPIMKMASAIVTDAGGRTSHAAIVSRELGIPAVLGCGNATVVLKDGQEVTVSCAEGEVGKVYEGLLKYEVLKTNLTNFQAPKMPIKMIIADPEQAFKHCQIPNKGVGLARQEFIISNFIKIHPKALIDYKKLSGEMIKKQIDDLTVGYEDKIEYYIEKLSFGIAQLAAAFYPYDVLLRFSDFKSNEYANLIGGRMYEPMEENPMIGWRGASRYYDKSYEHAFSLEVAAVKKVREEMGLWNLSVMVPFCRTPEEGKKVIEIMEKYGLSNRISKKQRQAKKNGDLVEQLEVWVMAEIPSNILQAEEFAEIFDGFSIGSNDLTQLTLGLDRDSKLISHIGNERSKAVQKLIKMLINTAHEKNLKVGICGQGPSDFPDFAEFLVNEGIDSISINPDTVLKASVNIKEVEDKLGK